MKVGQIVAIAGAIILTIVIYLTSRTPQEPTNVQEPQQEASSSEADLDSKVQQAVEIITSGNGAPMQAIGLLREVIQVDSNHVEANYWLGEFSMMSGQFDKAIKRFNKLLKLQPSNVEYCIKLAQAYEAAGQPNEGVSTINEFILAHPEETDNEQLLAVLEKMSVEL